MVERPVVDADASAGLHEVVEDKVFETRSSKGEAPQARAIRR
jgi:hypothetical protein